MYEHAINRLFVKDCRPLREVAWALIAFVDQAVETAEDVRQADFDIARSHSVERRLTRADLI